MRRIKTKMYLIQMRVRACARLSWVSLYQRCSLVHAAMNVWVVYVVDFLPTSAAVSI